MFVLFMNSSCVRRHTSLIIIRVEFFLHAKWDVYSCIVFSLWDLHKESNKMSASLATLIDFLLNRYDIRKHAFLSCDHSLCFMTFFHDIPAISPCVFHDILDDDAFLTYFPTASSVMRCIYLFPVRTAHKKQEKKELSHPDNMMTRMPLICHPCYDWPCHLYLLLTACKSSEVPLCHQSRSRPLWSREDQSGIISRISGCRLHHCLQWIILYFRTIHRSQVWHSHSKDRIQL